jgi:hypothetical protein
MSSRKL